jgi:hypothetical protein
MISLYHYDVDDEDPIEIDISPVNAPISISNLHSPCPTTIFKGFISM